jgi:hypothetical protein
MLHLLVVPVQEFEGGWNFGLGLVHSSSLLVDLTSRIVFVSAKVGILVLDTIVSSESVCCMRLSPIEETGFLRIYESGLVRCGGGAALNDLDLMFTIDLLL